MSGSGFYEAKKSHLYDSSRSLSRPIEHTITNATNATTTATQIEKDLENLPLTEDILPVPGTKVTTTVRTYTYEIPSNTPNNSNTLSRKNLTYNTPRDGVVDAMPIPRSVGPQTVIYNTESYTNLGGGQLEKPPLTNQNYELREHYETNTIRHTDGPNPQQKQILPPTDHPGTQIEYNIHNYQTTENTTERTTYPPTNVRGPYPTTPTGPYLNNAPGQRPITHQYIYKETTNTINSIPQGGPPDGRLNEPIVVYPKYPVNAGPYPRPHPDPSNTINYSYTTTTSTTGPNRRGPDYNTPSPTLPPAPFPLDGGQYPITSNPPQRVEDLMESLGQV